MATSTFSKQFAVEKGKEDEFVTEMMSAVTPTLQKDFQSNFVQLHQDCELKEKIKRALSQ